MGSTELDNLARIEKLKREPSAKAELESLTRSGDARLKDAETGLEREFTATPATQAAYRTALGRRTDEIERAARRHGLRFARLASDQPIEDMVQRTLRQVGLLG